jgi:hypothetical protein
MIQRKPRTELQVFAFEGSEIKIQNSEDGP